MANRREFLKGLGGATAGICFTGCSMLSSAQALMAAGQAAAPRGKRREVTVGGRRVKVIDLHCHINVPEIWEVIQDHPVAPLEQEAQDNYLKHGMSMGGSGHDLDARLADMDQMGFDVQVISCNNRYYWMEKTLARKVGQIINERVAEACAAHPDRLQGMATVMLQHPDLAVEQLEECVKKYGMHSFTCGGSVNGEELSSPRFYPIWAKAQELGVLMFIHPMGVSASGERPTAAVEPRLQGNGWLGNVIGNPLETTIALTHLILEGTLDQFPNLKILSAHGGGYLASYTNRMDQCLTAFPAFCKPIKKLPSEYLKTLYYDSIVFSNEDLRHLIAKFGASHIVAGTDYGTRWNREAVDRILSSPDLSDADRIAVLGGTASKLVQIPEKI